MCRDRTGPRSRLRPRELPLLLRSCSRCARGGAKALPHARPGSTRGRSPPCSQGLHAAACTSPGKCPAGQVPPAAPCSQSRGQVPRPGAGASPGGCGRGSAASATPSGSQRVPRLCLVAERRLKDLVRSCPAMANEEEHPSALSDKQVKACGKLLPSAAAPAQASTPPCPGSFLSPKILGGLEMRCGALQRAMETRAPLQQGGQARAAKAGQVGARWSRRFPELPLGSSP